MRYFDDFEVGQVNRFGRYEVEEKEIIDFALRYDRQPFHIDREAAKQSHFGGLVASGWHTCAVMMRPGDVLSVRSEIVEVTPSRSRPDRGSVRIHNQILRQDDTVVAEVTSIAIILRRAAHTASEI